MIDQLWKKAAKNNEDRAVLGPVFICFTQPAVKSVLPSGF